jgi:hypothetical protein
MIPEFGQGGHIFIDGVSSVWCLVSDGRPGSSGNGYAMFSYNAQPLGWVNDGDHLIECVVGEHVMRGALDPRWEDMPRVAKLIHPRYTLNVERAPRGWKSTITDELTGRARSVKPRATKSEAIHLLTKLLHRRAARARSNFDRQWWLASPTVPLCERDMFQRALGIGPDLGSFVRNGEWSPTGWSAKQQALAADFAMALNGRYKTYFDPVPFVGTILATFMKSVLVDLYRGANEVVLAPGGPPMRFTDAELTAFRDRFRHSPMSDREYLDIVNSQVVMPLRPLWGRRKRWSNTPVADKKSFQPLRPHRDKDDFPFRWPQPPASRPFSAKALQR